MKVNVIKEYFKIYSNLQLMCSAPLLAFGIILIFYSIVFIGCVFIGISSSFLITGIIIKIFLKLDKFKINTDKISYVNQNNILENKYDTPKIFFENDNVCVILDKQTTVEIKGKLIIDSKYNSM